MTVHSIEPTRVNTHGPFDPARSPILTIEPDDTVVYRTLDARWAAGPKLGEDDGRGFPRDPELDAGHALCGPIAVRGAQPGDVLEIRIGDVRPSTWGWTWAGPMTWLEDWQRLSDEETVVEWRIDPDAGTASDLNDLGLTIPIRPFMGVMGNVPGASGSHPTAPPRRVGGNLDCRELITGSTLWLPVEAEGALFSVGDGHAAQGDGEVSGTAIECPMDRVELTFCVRKDLHFTAPRAQTAAGYITVGLGETLDRAAWAALEEMLSHLTEEYGLGRPQGLALASLVVDLRITQVVNGTLGVHAVLPPGAIQRT